MTIPPIPSAPALWGLLHAYLAPLASLATGLAGSVWCRGNRAAWLPIVGAASVLLGWALLAPADATLRSVPSAHSLPEALLGPAGAAVAGLAVSRWAWPRIGRWTPAALAAFAGWWLASTPVARPEFWRVWFGLCLLTWLLSRAVAGQAPRGLAAGLALWGGLAMAGAPPLWITIALVVAAAAAGLLAAGLRADGNVLPASVLAAAVTAADLGTGRLIRGGLDAADLACLAACGAPVLTGPIAARAGKRLGGAAPLAAACLAAAVAVAMAWLAARLMRR